MTDRAKRLAKFLEDIGWTIYVDETRCPGCRATVFGYPYCPQCGTKQKKSNGRKETLKQLEEAISFSLRE